MAADDHDRLRTPPGAAARPGCAAAPTRFLGRVAPPCGRRRSRSAPACAGWSNRPSANRLRRMRRTMSSMRDGGTWPDATAAAAACRNRPALSKVSPADSWSSPALRGLRRAVHRAPVRHHVARIAPVVLQHLVEQPVVLAGIDAVDAVVGAHHRAGMAGLDGDLEGQQVRFARRGRGRYPRSASCGRSPGR